MFLDKDPEKKSDNISVQAEQSGEEVITKMSQLTQLISSPLYKNNKAIFNALLGQLNKSSINSLENIERLRQDINYLEKSKFDLEQKHQQEFEKKKNELDNIILEQTKLNDTIEETISKQQTLLRNLEYNQKLFFSNYRKMKHNEDSDTFIQDLDFGGMEGSSMYDKSGQRLKQSNLYGGWKSKKNLKKWKYPKKRILYGGMNSLSLFHSEPVITPQEIDKQILVCNRESEKLKSQLEEQNDEVKRQHQIIQLFNKVIQGEVQQEVDLIRQRKRLKYQVSDLIANSKNVMEEKLSNLERLSEKEQELSKVIQKKMNYVVVNNKMMSKIKKHIGEIFQALVPGHMVEQKRKKRVIDTYNKLKMPSKDNFFQRSLDEYLGSFLKNNFERFSEKDLDELLEKINSPNQDTIKKLFYSNQMSGGGSKMVTLHNKKKTLRKNKKLRKSIKSKKN